MMSRFLLWATILLGFASHLFAQDKPAVRLGSRHMMMLQADQSFIWGSYYFAVINTSQEPQRFQAVIAMPKEAVEFRPQEGLQAQDLHQDAQGHVVVEKDFPPGNHLMALGFQVPIRRPAQLSVVMATDVPEFSVSTPLSSQITVVSPQLKDGIPSMLQSGQFQGMVSEVSLNQGDKVEIFIHGIPEGRGVFWALGFLAFGLLLCMAIFLTYRTHLPRSE